MSVVGRLEADLELKASALEFFEIFSTRIYELPNIYPDIIQSLDIVEGELGTPGFVVFAQYKLEGKSYEVKEMVEEINLVNFSITFNVIEGGILEQYKSMKFIIKLTPNILEGSVVHWTIEYEKLNQQVPDPNILMREILQVSKDIDTFLTEPL